MGVAATRGGGRAATAAAVRTTGGGVEGRREVARMEPDRGVTRSQRKRVQEGGGTKNNAEGVPEHQVVPNPSGGTVARGSAPLDPIKKRKAAGQLQPGREDGGRTRKSCRRAGQGARAAPDNAVGVQALPVRVVSVTFFSSHLGNPPGFSRWATFFGFFFKKNAPAIRNNYNPPNRRLTSARTPSPVPFDLRRVTCWRWSSGTSPPRRRRRIISTPC